MAACLPLKVSQSAEERKPLWEAVEVGRENAPVALLYVMGAKAESELVVILALNAVQSALDRYPDCEAVEVGRERIPFEIVSGTLAVICVVEA
jgi:hypothetical protein